MVLGNKYEKVLYVLFSNFEMWCCFYMYNTAQLRAAKFMLAYLESDSRRQNRGVARVGQEEQDHLRLCYQGDNCRQQSSVHWGLLGSLESTSQAHHWLPFPLG